MDVTDILNIISGDDKILSQSFDNFINQNNQKAAFPELTLDLRKDFWNAISKCLHNEKYHIQSLTTIRILSREKENLSDVVDEKLIDKLLILSDLKTLEVEPKAADSKVTVEALKCLCNLIYNSQNVQKICEQNDVAVNVFKRLVSFRDLEILDEVKFFDMKLLFLITAFCTGVRMKVKENLNGVVYLTEYLVYILNQASSRNSDTNSKTILTDDEVNLVCEILKVLFNLTTYAEPNHEEDDTSMRLTAVVHDYFFVSTQSPTKQTELHTHIINLLTILPNYCLKKLVTIIPKGCSVKDEMEYDGHNMEAVYILLNYLKKKFDGESLAVRQQESLLPILTVLGKLAKSSRISRKYLRKNILPPLRDVHNRPEQGNTLRNNLCKLLTTPITQIRDLAADLLFVICKENVGRMIKYTGYGNAAGLFASRGLLGRASTGNYSDDNEKYSSDSEDSDTEEYKEYKHGINPVVGCYEPPHPDPTAGMTEEQKEYEAMKLVNLIDDLQKTGIIQPCRVGADGKPEPVSHVLQLQEEFAKKNGS